MITKYCKYGGWNKHGGWKIFMKSINMERVYITVWEAL